MTVKHAVQALLEALKSEHPEVSFPAVTTWDLKLEVAAWQEEDATIRIVVHGLKFRQETR